MIRLRFLLTGSVSGLILGFALGAPPAFSHDPSAYGGLFRSRDDGATWLPANPGRVVTGAIALAVSPSDPAHLLLATDSGLLRSRNGGLEWTLEGPVVLVGPVFAVAFASDGQRALAATTSGLFRTDDGKTWHPATLPAGAAPARALVTGSSDRVYLAGWTGLYRSRDWAGTWEALNLPDSPEAPVTTVLAGPGRVYAVIGSRIFAREDNDATWQSRDRGLPAGGVDALGADPRASTRLWAVAAGLLWSSDDDGASWQAIGHPLPDSTARTRAIAVASTGSAVTLATDHGLYRSLDTGKHWELLSDTLPAHLEAWPLVRDPNDSGTLYAGFALIPYLELWGLAVEGRTVMSRLDVVSVAGGIAFLSLLGLGATFALRRLGRRAARIHG